MTPARSDHNTGVFRPAFVELRAQAQAAHLDVERFDSPELQLLVPADADPEADAPAAAYELRRAGRQTIAGVIRGEQGRVEVTPSELQREVRQHDVGRVERGGDGLGVAPGTGGGGAVGFGDRLLNPRGNNAPDNARAGSPGSNGVNGVAGPAFGMFAAGGVYVPLVAANGTAGTPGSGAGGGGSGSGDAKPVNLVCVNASSGSGGGGGAGGCAGKIGAGGGGGGGSFALVSVSSMVVTDRCQLEAGRGGDGGVGGAGGLGGEGGSGRAGGAPSSATAGHGAPGKNGAPGGAAGSAAGGAGGPSICVLHIGSAPSRAQTGCDRAGGGAGGPGGRNSVLGQAPNGPDGISTDVRVGA